MLNTKLLFLFRIRPKKCHAEEMFLINFIFEAALELVIKDVFTFCDVTVSGGRAVRQGSQSKVVNRVVSPEGLKSLF